MTKVFIAIVLLTAAAVAQMPVPALPQVYIDSTYRAPSGGQTWKAHTSNDFKNALSTAVPGDMIVLDAGVTYQGNFTLPAKANPNGKWIYLVSSALASLPAPGNRVGPADAPNMPKIVSTTVTAPVTMAAGANHFRLVGLEIYGASTYGCKPTAMPPQNCFGYELIASGTAIGKPMVDSITIDRCYIHGSATIDQQRGVNANGSNYAVIDSYIADIHMQGVDTQAIGAWFSPGPIKIVNNYLEAAGENVMFGGAGGLNNPWVPSDIEIRKNYLFKPPSWARVGVSIPPNNTMVVKNHLEFKSARRVLVDGNVFENVWVSGQTGYSIVLTPRTNSSGLLSVVDDISITNNILKNVNSGIDALPWDNYCLPANGCTNVGESRRVKIYNNLIQLRDPKLPGGSNNFGLLLLRDTRDLVFQHNTILAPPGASACYFAVYFDAGGKGLPAPPNSLTQNVWILDNVLCRQTTGPGGSGMVGLNYYMSNPAPFAPRYLGNVMYVPTGERVQPWPVHNYATTLPPTFVNPGQGNYQLSVPNWTDTSDGRIAGINNSTLH